MCPAYHVDSVLRSGRASHHATVDWTRDVLGTKLKVQQPLGAAVAQASGRLVALPRNLETPRRLSKCLIVAAGVLRVLRIIPRHRLRRRIPTSSRGPNGGACYRAQARAVSGGHVERAVIAHGIRAAIVGLHRCTEVLEWGVQRPWMLHQRARALGRPIPHTRRDARL